MTSPGDHARIGMPILKAFNALSSARRTIERRYAAQ